MVLGLSTARAGFGQSLVDAVVYLAQYLSMTAIIGHRLVELLGRHSVFLEYKAHVVTLVVGYAVAAGSCQGLCQLVVVEDVLHLTLGGNAFGRLGLAARQCQQDEQ